MSLDATETAPADPALAARTMRKVWRRLIPFMFLLYIVNYLDRINVGFAALQMNQTIGLGASAYGLGAGVFFLSYVAFEIPSNLILARVGARLWIARIMITWGLVSAATMFVRDAHEFYALRFLLGAAEAGFFPGLIYHLTRWFPEDARARAVSGFMVATVTAGIIGGPISGALLSMHGLGGLAGWQWLFLLEGLPAVVLGVVTLRLLTDRPEQAGWLATDERAWLVARLHAESAAMTAAHDTLRDTFASGRVWLMTAIYFTLPLGLYGVGFWLPQIIQGFSHGSDFVVGVLSAIPYLAGAIGMVLVGRHSDRTGERRWHIAAPAFAGAAGFVLVGLVASPGLSLFALSLATAGLVSVVGPFWTLSTSFLRGRGAAGGIALINSVGNISGFIGPALLGVVKDTTHSFAAGMWMLGAALALGGLLALAVRPARRGTRLRLLS